MYPVYLITGTNTKQYVGCVLTDGKTVEKRFDEHLRGVGNATYLRNAIKKHGKQSFAVKQIDAGNTPQETLELEQQWIKRLGTKAPTGYNLTDGGEGTQGMPLTPEHRHKLSEANKGNASLKESGHRQGIANTESGLMARIGSPEVRSEASCQAGCRKGGHTTGQKNIESGHIKTILHTRWHTRRNVVNPACPLCVSVEETNEQAA